MRFIRDWIVVLAIAFGLPLMLAVANLDAIQAEGEMHEQASK